MLVANLWNTFAMDTLRSSIVPFPCTKGTVCAPFFQSFPVVPSLNVVSTIVSEPMPALRITTNES